MKIIVTSRPAGYSGWTLDGFEVIHIRPLSSDEAANLACTYYIAAGENKTESEILTQKLICEIERLPTKIREYPLFICLLASLFRDKQGDFPAKRGGLLHVSLDTLLGTWTTRKYEGKTLQEMLKCSPEQIVKCLAEISYRAFTEVGVFGNTDTPDVPISMALEEFYLLGEHINPTQVLNYITNQAGILTSPAQRKLRFVHRLFQEYLAALAISDYQDDSIAKMTKLVIEDPILWTEIALLFADILSNKKLCGELVIFIEQLLEKSENSCNIASIIALVSSIIVEEDFHKLDDAITKSASIQACVEKLNSALLLDCLNGKQRNLVGLALNELGDPRPGVSLEANGLPNISWVLVDGGECYIGSGKQDAYLITSISSDRNWNLDREKPQHKVHVNSFEVSKYSITNEQFCAFVFAEDGYACDNWWTTSGKEWRDNNGPPPTISTLTKNSPQNCVTWFEAHAFCQWYSFKTESVIRLPTEVEWEYIARKNGPFQYFWGNECSTKFANVKETGIGTVSPVGCFPIKDRNRGHLEVYDLNGNIWEWCSSIVEDDQGNKFAYPYNPTDGREDYNKDEHYFRATRGGYYGGEWMYARSCYRGRDIPSLRAERQGFRVVREIE